MKTKILADLFCNIEKVTGVKDIGYHEIIEGKLNPVYKTNTDILGINKWKKVHSENPVYVKNTVILEEIMETCKPAVVQSVKTDKRSSDAFFLFGIDSILILPVLESQKIKGIICVASIGKSHKFTGFEVELCEMLIKDSQLKQIKNAV